MTTEVNTSDKNFKYEDITFVFGVFGMAYHTTQLESGRNPEYWDTNDSRRFRELLGGSYAHYDEDRLRRAAVSFRKKSSGDGGWVDYKSENNIQGKRGGNGKGYKPELNPELEEHRKTEEYALAKDAAMYGRDRKCPSCGRPEELLIQQTGKGLGFHHCWYGRIKTLDEYKDMIPVCDECHSFMDSQRKKYHKAVSQFLQKGETPCLSNKQ